MSTLYSHSKLCPFFLTVHILASVPHIKIQSKEDITIRPSLDISSPSLSSLVALVRGWEWESLEWGEQRSSVAGYPQRWGGIPQPLVASMYASPYIGDDGFLGIMSSFNSESGPCHNLAFRSNLLPFRYGNMGTTEVNLMPFQDLQHHTHIYKPLFSSKTQFHSPCFQSRLPFPSVSREASIISILS